MQNNKNERRERIAQMVREALKKVAPCTAHQAKAQPCAHTHACPNYTPVKQALSSK